MSSVTASPHLHGSQSLGGLRTHLSAHLGVRVARGTVKHRRDSGRIAFSRGCGSPVVSGRLPVGRAVRLHTPSCLSDRTPSFPPRGGGPRASSTHFKQKTESDTIPQVPGTGPVGRLSLQPLAQRHPRHSPLSGCRVAVPSLPSQHSASVPISLREGPLLQGHHISPWQRQKPPHSEDSEEKPASFTATSEKADQLRQTIIFITGELILPK